MTDSSSKDKPLSTAEMMMAQDLMESKIAEAKANSKMTHLLMFGNFRMEIVPSADTNVEKIFKDTMSFLHEKYGDGILKTETPSAPLPMGGMHG
tara:strand:- start:3 stop:284 length:282 start_codon:yes stop_codon:yes gene_type:complete